MSDKAKEDNKASEAPEPKTDAPKKDTYYVPNIGGEPFTVEANSTAEADEKIKKITKGGNKNG